MKFVSVFILATVLVAAYAGDKAPAAAEYEEPTAPAYEPAKGYDAPPAYEPATGYDAPPAYDAPAGYGGAAPAAPSGGYGSTGGYTAGHRFPRYKHNLYIAPPPFSGKSSWDGYLPSTQLKAGTGGIRTWTLPTFNQSYLGPASHYGLGFGSHGHGPTYQSYIHSGDAEFGKDLLTDAYVQSPQGYKAQYDASMWADQYYGAPAAAAPSGYGSSYASAAPASNEETYRHFGYGKNEYGAANGEYAMPAAAAYEAAVSAAPPAKPAKEYVVPEATKYAPPAAYEAPPAAYGAAPGYEAPSSHPAPAAYGKAPTPHYAEPAYAPAPEETYGEEPAYEVDDPQYAPTSGGYGASRGGYTAGHRFPRYKHNLYIAPPPFSGKSSWDGYLPSTQLKANAGGIKGKAVPTFNTSYLPPAGAYGLGYGSHGHGPTYKSYLHDWGNERYVPTYATYTPSAGKGYLPGYDSSMWADSSYGTYGAPGYGGAAPASGYGAPAPAGYAPPKVDYGEKASKEGNYVPQVSHEGYEPVQKAEVTHAAYEEPATHDAYEVKESPKPAAGYGGY